VAHILLVEDDEQVVRFCRAALAPLNYSLEAAGDGEAGLEAYARRRPDLILLDVFLPRLDGLHLVRELRARFPGDHVPIVVWTGAYEPAAIGDQLDTPHVLPKPVGSDELLEVVRRALHVDTRARALRVLVMSRSTAALRALVAELRTDFDVHTASHWEEALALADVRPYEALVVDFPSENETRDGAALLRTIAQRHREVGRLALAGPAVQLADLLASGAAEVLLEHPRPPNALAEKLHALVG
jgi:CheY-like chemotaxis protein